MKHILRRVSCGQGPSSGVGHPEWSGERWVTNRLRVKNTTRIVLKVTVGDRNTRLRWFGDFESSKSVLSRVSSIEALKPQSVPVAVDTY